MAESSDAATARLSRPTLTYMAKRVLAEFSRDGGTDQAAKLTYFMVLSVAPTLLAVFSLATLLLAGFQDEIAELVQQAVSSAIGGSGTGLREAVDSTVGTLLGSATGGTLALIIGIGTALWSASAYVKAYGRVANQIYGVPEGRGPVRLNLWMLGLTAVLVVGILLILVAVMLSRGIVEGLLGPVAETMRLTGTMDFLLDSFLPVWAWVKWPVVLMLAFALISLLYWGAPNLRKPFRFISPGGVVAIVGIAVAAVAVSIYMSSIASYSSYGAIGGIMAVLFALWIMNIVILLGAEVDAEFERAKELQAGRPAEESLTLELRGSEGAEKAELKREALVDAGRDLRLRSFHREDGVPEEQRLTPPQEDPGSDAPPEER